MAPLNCSNLKPTITLDSSLSPHLYPFLTAPPPPNSLKFIYFSMYSKQLFKIVFVDSGFHSVLFCISFRCTA